MPTPTESALQNVRVEWVEESTMGEAPSDPSFNKYGDYVVDAPGWDGDAGTESFDALGSVDPVLHNRGPEEHSLAIEYYLQRFPLDNSDTIQDPIAYPMEYDPQTGLPSHTVVFRRDVGTGGNDGAGFRQYVVGLGQLPISASLPGDPSTGEPIVAALGYEGEYVRSHVIHQPSSSTTVEVSSTSANDTTQTVTIEDEGAGTTEDVTLSGTTAQTTTATFDNIDAIHIDESHEGDISVTDGSGTDLLENDLQGTNSDGVDYEVGVPALGSGSHASDLSTDPENFTFLGTSSSYGGDGLDDRVHAFDLSVEIDTASEPRQTTRRPAIDPGTRTVSVDADIAGPHQSDVANYEYFTGQTNDITYALPNGDIVVTDAQLMDTDEQSFGSSDANNIYSVTWEGTEASDGTAAITLTNTA